MTMRRKDRQQSEEFALQVIDRCTHGTIAFQTDDGCPYCIPLSLARSGKTLYFHGAREGQKIDLLRKNPRVCVSFVAEDSPAFVPPAMYTTYFQSAVVTGTAVEVTDDAEKKEALRLICAKMTPQNMGESFEAAAARSLKVTSVWRIVMETITGKAKLR